MLSDRVRRYLVSTPILISLFFTIYILKDTHQHNPTANANTKGPEAVMENVIAIQMNSSGHIQSKLHTPKMVRYPGENRVTILQPRLEIYNATGKPWQIVAKQGEATETADKIELWQEVRIKQPNNLYQNSTTLLTERLSIFPNDKIAKTSQAVTVQQPGITMQARGLNANIGSGHIELLSNVEGQYETGE